MFIVRWIIRILPFSYMGLIWYLSSRAQDAVIKTGLSYDAQIKEALHLVEFAGLYVLWIAFFWANNRLTTKTMGLSAALAIGYGFVDEIHQFFVPYRSFSVIDLLKDAIGVFVFHFMFIYMIKKRNAPK